MKTALYTLTLPVLWIWQICLLIVAITVHMAFAPIRAFVYWGRLLKRNPGWHGVVNISADTQFGIWVPKEVDDASHSETP